MGKKNSPRFHGIALNLDNMAANFQSSSTQTEENLADYMCVICVCDYDLEIRKPKFLPCSHTICLPCLQVCLHQMLIFLYNCINKILNFFFRIAVAMVKDSNAWFAKRTIPIIRKVLLIYRTILTSHIFSSFHLLVLLPHFLLRMSHKLPACNFPYDYISSLWLKRVAIIKYFLDF